MRIDVSVTVASPDVVRSPVSGAVGAFVHVEVLEEADDAFEPLGSVIFGDLVTFAIDGTGETLDVLVRRAELRFASLRPEPAVLSSVPAELVASLGRARHGGALCWREHLVRQGDRLRLRADVERIPGRTTLAVRDDVARVVLEERVPTL